MTTYRPIEDFLNCDGSKMLWDLLKDPHRANMARGGSFPLLLRDYRMPTVETIGGVEYRVVAEDDYRVLFNDKDFKLEVRSDATPEVAFNTMQKVFGDRDGKLTGAELVVFYNQGIEIVRGKEHVFPEESQEILLKFVQGYCDGRVYTSDDVPPNMLGMVFMPIMLGGMALPDEVLDLLPKEPDECPTFSEPEPTPEPEPQMAAQPEPPVFQVPDDAEVDRLKRGEFFKTLPEGESVEGYLAQIQAVNAVIQADYDKVCAEIAHTNANITKAQEATRKKNARALSAWKKRKDKFETETVVTWERTHAQNVVIRAGARIQYWKDLGCIWEEMAGNNTAGRSINGYPMFFSCRLMSKAGYKRARVAINREMEHRKNLTI